MVKIITEIETSGKACASTGWRKNMETNTEDTIEESFENLNYLFPVHLVIAKTRSGGSSTGRALLLLLLLGSASPSTSQSLPTPLVRLTHPYDIIDLVY